MDSINWSSIIVTQQLKPSIFLVKFLSKWLPVGKQVNRYNPTAYPSKCPSCDCPVEDFDHVFRCHDRRKWWSALRQDLFQLFDRSNTNPVNSRTRLSDQVGISSKPAEETSNFTRTSPYSTLRATRIISPTQMIFLSQLN